VVIWLKKGCLFKGNLGDDNGALKRGRKTVVTEQGTDSKIVIESVLDLDKVCLAPVHSGSSHVYVKARETLRQSDLLRWGRNEWPGMQKATKFSASAPLWRCES
jgi:hypothetical protein